MMEFQHNDGGRAAAGFRGPAGDCAVRAVAITQQRDYREVFDDLNQFAKQFEQSWSPDQGEFFPSSSDGGYWPEALKAYLKPLGWEWVPSPEPMSQRLHMRAEELPGGSIIVLLRGQYCAVVDGVIQNTNDCRDAYFALGYWHRPDATNA